MQIGCQTYTWEMLGDAWQGRPEDLLDAIAGTGYAGIEITDNMIGHFASDAGAFSAALASRGLTLIAYAVASPTGFTDKARLRDDVERSEEWLRFLAAFPRAVCALGCATAHGPGDRNEMIDAAAEYYNEVGRRGREHGVPVAFHPSSHPGSVLTSRADYARIMERTDPELVGWVPDTGHLIRGRQDPLEALRTFAGRIRYIHLKDAAADCAWRMLGEGVCNVPELVATARRELGFDGWFVLEEESSEAAGDPAGAVRRNREYMARLSGKTGEASASS